MAVENAENSKAKPGRRIRRALIVLLMLVAVLIAGVFVVHRVKRASDYAMLQEAGLARSISVGGYALNVCAYGNENGAHTLVGLSGMGVLDYNVTLGPVTDALARDNRIVFVDRAGYGLSDDTDAAQTIEQIVEDYRAALKGAGVEPPYVLLPHSLGGAYATYWESKYPDEIEGVVFLDGTELGDDVDFGDDWDGPLLLWLQAVGCKLGLHRLVFREFYYELPDSYTDRQKRFSDALNCYNMFTFAQRSEELLIYDNCRAAYDAIIPNGIPKLYICASWAMRTREEYREYERWVNERLAAAGEEPMSLPDELVDELIEQARSQTESVLMPYLEKLGSCEYVELPGDHYIFEQKPRECAALIGAFLERLTRE